MEEASVDWPIVLQYDVKAKYIDWFLESSRAWIFFPRAFVSVPVRAFSFQGYTEDHSNSTGAMCVWRAVRNDFYTELI